MSKKSFELVVKELSTSVDACFETRLNLPGLILLYSSIDIMAWLARPQSQHDSTPTDFTNWVKLYLLPNSKLQCNSSDLYGARCSTLHSASAESSKSRKGNALKIYYTYGGKQVSKLQNGIDSTQEPALAIHIDVLLEAFYNGVKNFKKTLLKNDRLSSLVYERANKFLVNTRDLPP